MNAAEGCNAALRQGVDQAYSGLEDGLELLRSGVDMTCSARPVSLFAMILLGGCASGTIIGSEPSMAEASFLYAKAGVIYSIWPIHRSRRVEIDQQSPTGVWLTKGWYTVSYACQYIHLNTPDWAISITEYETTRNIHILSNRRIELQCSSTKLDVLEVHDRGAARPN